MRILLVNDYATETGGAEIATLALREGLRNRGHDARLFATTARPNDVRSLADYECYGTTSRFRTLLQTANPAAFFRFREVLSQFKPDLVHVNLFLTQLSPLILPLLEDIPSCYHVHWYRPICPLGTKMLPDGSPCKSKAGKACYFNHCLPISDFFPLILQMRLWRFWRRVFNRIVTNSEALKQYLIEEGIEPVEVIYYGFYSQQKQRELSELPTVVFAGRLVKEKGVDLLLRAFKRVSEELSGAKLLIAGDGPERNNLAKLITNLKLESSATLLGYLTQEEMEREFSSAWVQAVPSRWPEPFGIVATEAMNRGVAVVASAHGGLTEIVEDDNTGFLVPPNDVESLADRLLSLLKDRELASQMGRAGQEISSLKFSRDSYTDKFIKLYEGMLLE